MFILIFMLLTPEVYVYFPMVSNLKIITQPGVKDNLSNLPETMLFKLLTHPTE